MKFATRKSVKAQKGFTLVELSVVVLVAGLMLTAVMKGQTMLEGARGQKLYNEIKNTESLVLSYESLMGRLPGDCDRDGIADFDLATLGSSATTPLAYKTDTAGNTDRAAAYDFTNGSLAATFVTGSSSTTNLVACLESNGASTDEGNANRFLNDLKRANLINVSASNRVLAKHTANDFMFFGKFVNAGSAADGINGIAIANVPAGTARQVLMKINGTEDADKGQLRVLDTAGALSKIGQAFKEISV